MARIPVSGALAFATFDDGGLRIEVPPGAHAVRTSADGERASITGPAQVRLGAREAMSVAVGSFSLHAEASGADAPAAVCARGSARSGAALHITLAALFHGAILTASSHAALAGVADGDHVDVSTMSRLLVAAEGRARATERATADSLPGEDGALVNGKPGNGKAGGGTRAGGAEGAAGSAMSRTRERRRYAAPAVSLSDAVALPSADLRRDAQAFGMIGLLSSAPPAARDGVAWGTSTRHDAFAANGQMWARTIGDAPGANALGLSGIGEGGGGFGQGIGLGRIGTLGHADGPPGEGTGGSGFGIAHGRLGWSHKYRPYVCTDSCAVSGRLPPEAVQRIVRQNFGRFRLCYEKALMNNPSLAGRVTTKFVIGRDGTVFDVADGGSDLRDPNVVSCVVRAFDGLSFPQPEGGVVFVSYPITFTPD